MVEVPRVRTPSTGAQALSLVDVFEETSRANSRKKRQVKESCGSPPNGAEALLAALEMSAHSAHQMAPSSSRPPPSENYVAMDVAHAESPAGFYVHLAAQKAGLKRSVASFNTKFVSQVVFYENIVANENYSKRHEPLTCW